MSSSHSSNQSSFSRENIPSAVNDFNNSSFPSPSNFSLSSASAVDTSSILNVNSNNNGHININDLNNKTNEISSSSAITTNTPSRIPRKRPLHAMQTESISNETVIAPEMNQPPTKKSKTNENNENKESKPSNIQSLDHGKQTTNS